MTEQEFTALKRKLDFIFHYLGRTIGLVFLVAGYWMARTGVIETFAALLWVFVAAAIGLYGNRVNFEFLKHILRVKQNPPSNPSDNDTAGTNS